MSPQIHLFMKDADYSDSSVFQISVKDDMSSTMNPSIIGAYILVRPSGIVWVIRNILK